MDSEVFATIDVFFSKHGCDPLIGYKVSLVDRLSIIFYEVLWNIKSGPEYIVSYNTNVSWLNLFQSYVYMSWVEIVNAFVHYG